MRRAALALAIAGGCSAAAAKPSPPHTTVDAGTPAAVAADAAPAPLTYAAAIRAADWARWPGLPTDLRERTLVHDLGLSKASVTRTPGQLSRKDVVIVDAGDVRYYVRDRDHVVLVELTKQLGAIAPTDLLARLPAPDRDGAGRYLVSGATTTEYVFGGRGLAITVAASYDHPPRFAPHLAQVQLFAAGDLRTFELDLGGNDHAGPSR